MTVRNIRLEPAAEAAVATLRFDLHNDGSLSATDIVLQITVLDSEDEREGAARSIIAGPFTVRARVVLSPRFSMEYEMTLPRISSPCHCLPTVDVVLARWIEKRQA